MDEQEFYDRVESRASFESGSEALTITHATLEAFSERISEGQAHDLTDDLPRPIAESLTHHHGDPASSRWRRSSSGSRATTRSTPTSRRATNGSPRCSERLPRRPAGGSRICEPNFRASSRS
ncbi:DUF2267 domain-containing protein [Halalkalicoccus sp. GCM10025322]|uniref:DUF2267 domain-containing protein n=1 Tax=Halalkalicoccus TaxID=332246 RepID=UPI003607A01E